MTHPWASERTVSVETAHTVVTEVLGLSPRQLEPLGEGWDYKTFLVNSDWVLRLPKRALCDRALCRERELLDQLAICRLPASIPHYITFAEPSEHFPWHSALYKKLPGHVLGDLDQPNLVEAVAPSLGRFIRALHAAKPKSMPPSPWPEAEADAPYAALSASSSLYPDTLYGKLAAYLALPPPPIPPVANVFTHADLGVEHILVNPATEDLSGVIDWGDACIGPRSRDFIGILLAGGRGAAEAAYCAYGERPSHEEWDWLFHQAVLAGVEQAYYHSVIGRMDKAATMVAHLQKLSDTLGQD